MPDAKDDPTATPDPRQPAWDLFLLSDNPFDPIKYQATGTSLAEPLDIAKNAHLEELYFKKGGCFLDMANRIDAFLSKRSNLVDRKPPFATLVYGKEHVGLDSAASYVAHRIKQRCRLKPAPTVKTLPVGRSQEHTFLAQVTAHVKAHAKKNEIDVTANAEPFEKLVANATPADQVSNYAALLGNLKDDLMTAPWLILIVDDISQNQREWMSRSHKTFADAKVAPIYISKAPWALSHFKNTFGDGKLDGLLLELAEIDADAAVQFVAERMARFRKGTTATAEFPFAAGAVKQLVKGEAAGMAMKFLVSQLTQTINDKASEILTLTEEKRSAAVPIPYSFIKDRYQGSLPNGARK